MEGYVSKKQKMVCREGGGGGERGGGGGGKGGKKGRWQGRLKEMANCLKGRGE